ncbi:unnamed protein product [Nezara viridula]|uniref:Uncharacterized protein n=1 Tax=Nezara viridula TaxID=85310 RepID=A0A9P0EFE2_NEZVI|nr:unnamed protein product [Nezara viridula]
MDFSDPRSQDMVLPLEDSGKGEVTGELYITASLLPKSQEDKELVSPQNTHFAPVIYIEPGMANLIYLALSPLHPALLSVVLLQVLSRANPTPSRFRL